MRKTSVRLAAAGALSVAALSVGAGSALAATDYAPVTPVPSVTDDVTPGVSPTTGGSTPSAVAGSGGELAYTGADVLPWALGGGVLLAGGAALVLAGRKTARQH
ncbi:hypothetical protein ACFFKU_17675 [Kineococcus gynurae]|uniref:LPXTG-motif cell wall-anchored protein n=1 Tax=Kineococcus gynurae TaxID=452979 RepID=A0ABV5LNP7_9ACTN